MLHVDNFMFVGTELFHECVTEKIGTKFTFGFCNSDMFKYVELNIVEKTIRSFCCNMNMLTILLFEIDSFRDDTELSPDKMSLLRKVGDQKPPDLSFHTLEMSASRNRALQNLEKVPHGYQES